MITMAALSAGVWAGIIGAIVTPFGFPFVLLAVACMLAIGTILERG